MVGAGGDGIGDLRGYGSDCASPAVSVTHKAQSQHSTPALVVTHHVRVSAISASNDVVHIQALVGWNPIRPGALVVA